MRTNTKEHQQVATVHAPFWPKEVRPGEGITAQITGRRGGLIEAVEVKVWRISPLGGEFVMEGSRETLATGDHVNLRMKVNNQLYDFVGLVISERRELQNSHLVAVRWSAPGSNQQPDVAREARRWTTSPAFFPTGVAANPIMFSDFVLFRVVDVSAKGMKIQTSMRNKFILPKMQLQANVLFPTVGNAAVRFKIVWTSVESEDGKDFLTCGAEFENPSGELKSVIGQYLFQFSESATTSDLCAAGLTVRTTASGVSIDYVRNDEDYVDVLKLRARCYKWVTGGDESQYLKLADEYDARSRIMVARRQGQAIGSFRLVFHNIEDQLEQQRHVELPEDFPRNDELLEITRICTDSEYRGSDLFYFIAKHSIVAALQAGRRWGVSACTDQLWPLYQKLGFKKVGRSYEVPGHGVTVHVIIVDIPAIIRGIGIHPIVWNLLGFDVVPFVTANGLVTLDSSDRVRMAMIRLLKPLAKILANRFSLRSQQKRAKELDTVKTQVPVTPSTRASEGPKEAI